MFYYSLSLISSFFLLFFPSKKIVSVPRLMSMYDLLGLIEKRLLLIALEMAFFVILTD